MRIVIRRLLDGLVNISELSDKFVKKPADVVRINQKVSVTVLTIVPERKRISLSMRPDVSSPVQSGSGTSSVPSSGSQIFFLPSVRPTSARRFEELSVVI